MDNKYEELMLLHVYGNEIITLCGYGLRAHDAAMKAYTTDDVREDFWYHVRSFLNFSADVSKFFFVSKKGTDARNKRAKSLRHLFNVPDDSPINTAGRKIRNCLEHIDERFDAWALGKKPFIVIGCTGNVPLERCIVMSNQDGTTEQCHQLFFYSFNHSTNTVSFQTEALCLEPLTTELKRLITTEAELTGY